MSVHWHDPENPTKYPRQPTIRYPGPFMGPGSKPQVKPGKNRKKQQRLAARQAAFDANQKGNAGRTRPGSIKK